jgi:hypothetical protein
MDDSMHASFGGDLEIERRLDRYAQVRLSPAPDVAARIRARVMREARLGFAAQAERVANGSLLAERTLQRRSTLIRRGGALLLAAGLALGVVGSAMAASQAGGPLYDARVWLEMVVLPSNVSDRADAEVARLESRLVELMTAARSGDQSAVAAALAAYEQIADEAVAAAGGDLAVLQRISDALGRHVAVLEGVAANAPERAREAIEANIARAIAHNDAAIDRIGAQPQAAPPAPKSAPKPNNGQDKTPKPTAAPTPTPTATPDKAPKTEPSDGPVATPIPNSSEAPHGQPSQKPDKTPPARGNSSP